MIDHICFTDSAQARERNIITYAPIASKILKMYCENCDINMLDIQGMSRKRPLPEQRSHIMLLIMMFTHLSLADIGKLFFSGRHYSTVLHQAKAAKDDIETYFFSSEKHKAWLNTLKRNGFEIRRKEEELCKSKPISATI